MKTANKTIQLIFLLGLLLSFLLIASPTKGEEIKIGYVDSNRLKAEFNEFANAQKRFENELKRWQNQADSMQSHLEALRDEYERQSLMLSDAKKREKEEEFRRKQKEYQDFTQRVLGPEGEAAQREIELSRPVIEKINQAIQKVAIRDNYTYVLDTAGGDILYAKPHLDITDSVLEELSKK